MNDDFIKLIGILVVSMFIIYIIIKSFQLQTNVIEGLTNNSTTPLSGSPEAQGLGAVAATNSANIKSKIIQLQDTLLVSKYRKDYENLIINLDDLISYTMLQQILKLGNLSGDVKQNMTEINSLKMTKDALNETMKFLDRI